MKLAILVLHARTKIGNSIRNKKRKTRQVVGAKRQQLGLSTLLFSLGLAGALPVDAAILLLLLLLLFSLLLPIFLSFYTVTVVKHPSLGDHK